MRNKSFYPARSFYEKAYPQNQRLGGYRSIYGWLYHMLKGFETYREDVVMDLLDKGDKFLDIGSGEGNLVFKALSKFRSVFGTDIATTRLKRAEKKANKLNPGFKKRVKFVFGDVDNKLPFAANKFDAITMVATFEHFFDPYHVIEEVGRILKPGGQLVIQVPNLAFFPRRLAVLLGKLPVTSEHESGWDGGHLHYFTIGSFTDFISQSGFNIQTVTCSGIFSNIRRIWLSFLAPDIIIKAIKL